MPNVANQYQSQGEQFDLKKSEENSKIFENRKVRISGSFVPLIVWLTVLAVWIILTYLGDKALIKEVLVSSFILFCLILLKATGVSESSSKCI